MTQLQAPIDLSSATRVGPRVYRKQVLEKRTIQYPMPDGTTREVVFDDQYLRDLADAYNDGAYDLVPFQLATPGNAHNEDPRNYGGRVLGAEVTEDGLDLILELAEDTAELVERTGRRLGVSARIKAVQHVDGRRFKRAIRHVLGTLDPRMQNLKPWEPVVDLSADDDEPLLDLSRYTDQQEGTTMPKNIDLSALDNEDVERLLNLAALEGIDLSAAVDGDDSPWIEDSDAPVLEDDEPNEGDDDPEGAEDAEEGDEEGDDEPDDAQDGDDDGDAITDAELEALLDAELNGVELSAEDDDPDGLDLAADGIAGEERVVQRDEAAELRAQLAAQEYARRGIPAHIVDLAAPVLGMSDDQADALDLSTPDGAVIDVRGVVRGMLDAVAGTIDLSTETGYGHETEPDEQVTDLATAWTDYLENN